MTRTDVLGLCRPGAERSRSQPRERTVRSANRGRGNGAAGGELAPGPRSRDFPAQLRQP